MIEPLVHQVRLRCSIGHAFETFTQRVDLWWPRDHRRFEDSTMTCKPEIGGSITELGPNGARFSFADITAIDAPNTLVLAWHPGKSSAPTQTDIAFEALGPHETRITVTHTEGEAALGNEWPKRAILFNRGWLAVLNAVQELIEKEGKQL